MASQLSGAAPAGGTGQRSRPVPGQPLKSVCGEPVETARTDWRRWFARVIGAANTIYPKPMSSPAATNRFQLWIDAVGGFLICTGDELVLGQATHDNRADVQIQADLSRRHAVLRRDQEGYVIEPVKTVRLDGQPIEQPTAIRDGRMIELGGVRIRFRRPHPLSGTVRLEFASFHRMQPAADGVIWMADSCIIGPGSQTHVAAPNLAADVVLFRQGDGLACRTKGRLVIDGVEQRGRGAIRAGSRVEGDDFAFSLEAV